MSGAEINVEAAFDILHARRPAGVVRDPALGLADDGELTTSGSIVPHFGTGDLAGIRVRATENAEGVLTLVHPL